MRRFGVRIPTSPRKALIRHDKCFLLKRKYFEFGEWRSPVAHLVWDQRVAGSNPVSPTISKRRRSYASPFFVLKWRCLQLPLGRHLNPTHSRGAHWGCCAPQTPCAALRSLECGCGTESGPGARRGLLRFASRDRVRGQAGSLARN